MLDTKPVPPINVRLTPRTLERVDEQLKREHELRTWPRPSRSTIIRKLIDEALAARESAAKRIDETTKAPKKGKAAR